MLFVAHFFLALFSITLLFLSNFDQRVSYSLLAFYIFIFLLRWAKNKIYFLVKCFSLFTFIIFGFAYLNNPKSDQYSNNFIASLKQLDWSEAKDNLVSFFKECDPCADKVTFFKQGFDKKTLSESLNQKSEKFRMMMTVIKNNHKDTEIKDLHKVLLEKSKNELIDLKVRFENAQKKSMVLRSLANQKDDFSHDSSDFDKLDTNNSKKYDHDFYSVH